VNVTVGVDDGVNVFDGVKLGVTEGVKLGEAKIVAVLVTDGVKVGVYVSVADGVTVGISDAVGESIEGPGLNVGNDVTVEANVGLEIGFEEEPGANMIAIPPMQ